MYIDNIYLIETLSRKKKIHLTNCLRKITCKIGFIFTHPKNES